MAEQIKRVNYVLTAWSGYRRGQRPHENPLDYLKKNLNQLNSLSHNLSQVTIVVSHNPDEPSEYRDYLNSLRLNTPFQIIEKSNEGLSYGCFSKAYEVCRNNFDYYIFMEDDYYFIEDNFDKILVDMFEELQPCSFLCGDTTTNGEVVWCSNSLGITSSEVLEEVFLQNDNRIPCERGIPGGPADDPYREEDRYQISYTQSFINTGRPLRSIANSSEYSSPFWAWNRERVENVGDKYLIVPFQK